VTLSIRQETFSPLQVHRCKGSGDVGNLQFELGAVARLVNVQKLFSQS
jgi:hypothetical protein